MNKEKILLCGREFTQKELDDVIETVKMFKNLSRTELAFGNKNRYCLKLNIVVCEESWEKVNKQTGEIELKKGKYAWLSHMPISKENVKARCNKIACSRWFTEETTL